MKNPLHPAPAPPAFGNGAEIPERNASIFSKIFLLWLSPILTVGFSRPLKQDDLWSLPRNWLTGYLADNLEQMFYADAPVDLRPLNFVANNTTTGSHQQLQLHTQSKVTENGKKEDREDISEKGMGAAEEGSGVRKSNSRPDQKPAVGEDPKTGPSLLKALHRQFFWRWWFTGFLTLVSQTLTTTTPLVNQVLLTWLVDSYVFAHLSAEEQVQALAAGLTKPRGIGYGIGVAFGLFVMQEGASLITAQSLQVGMSLGLSVRSAIIGNITRKSLRLSGRARMEHSSGQILTMISTDAARVDQFCMLGHHLWIAPVELIIAVGLLIRTLGYSAVVGLGVLILSLPVQTTLVLIMLNQRKKGVKITDSRIRLTTEVLQGIRLLKLYAWERFYVGKITDLRKGELDAIRKSIVATAMLVALMNFVPILAAVLSFVTYALTNHELNVAIIFTSLQFFNIIQIPLIILPATLGSLSDLFVAITRITKFLLAEDRPPAYPIDLVAENKNAIECEGDFIWDVSSGTKEEQVKSTGSSAKRKKEEKARQKEKRSQSDKTEHTLPTANPGFEQLNAASSNPSSSSEEQPFQLKNLRLAIPKGAFVAIIGRVGSGKSSILQALIGEMRKTSGQVHFGGSVAYVPQRPWIRNASVRENIMFGLPEDISRLSEIIDACSLTHDLNVLPNGEHTQIGEKGINISGGQKARISLARAAYSDCDIALLDDPLSAVDSHVGKDIMENCLLSGPLSHKTRVLVTHALHCLDKTDYIYVIQDGSIVEEGTHKDLVSHSETFAHLMNTHGQKTSGRALMAKNDPHLDVKNLVDDPLIQEEERNTGAVTWATYMKYFTFAGGLGWVPAIFMLLVLYQGCQVGTTLLLGFWTAESIPGFHEGDYIALYAGFGSGQAIFSFLLTWAFALVGIQSSLNLFASALTSVLASPVSFFDTTPLGRILSRLSKDQDTLDTILPLTMMQFLLIFSSVFGTIGLVFYTFPLLGILFAPMTLLYWLISVYYRRTSVETKRLDSLARSNFYSSFSETLTGIATVRAYRDEHRAMQIAERQYDLESRAYYITISLQRWLTLRLDTLANILILGIALFAAGFRNSVNPSKIGVVLTYSLSVSQLFSQMISQFTQNEQNMNAVERLLVYTELPSEEPLDKRPGPIESDVSWPAQGEIEFQNVDMAYREGLPLVLKDVSFRVKPGEKVGVVGRTGAGKSSLLQALFRLFEIQGGSIKIDGRDITNVDLETLRVKLALVPQDCILYLGTLRQNMDPLGMRTDAELYSVMQKACLLPKEQPRSPSPAELRFNLDSEVGDEGSNFSVGEKQLLALCRALVKNSQIIVLDEATSSIDEATDVKIQQMIQTEFTSSTLLCVAHRIHTVAYYDRILVMDGGQIAEFDTVLNLFDREDSIFRSLCNESGLSRADIVRLREAHAW